MYPTAPTDADRRLHRGARLEDRIAARIFALPHDAFVRFCMDHALLTHLYPQAYRVPVAVEETRTEGWARMDGVHPSYRDADIVAAVLSERMPANLRDSDGAVVGEVALIEARAGVLWGLLLWRGVDEEDGAWGARVRMARIMRGVGGLVVT